MRAALSFSSSLMLVIMASVVSMSAAIEAAFCKAERVTLVGSTMPALNMSTNSPVLASKPTAPSRDLTSSAMTPPSWPELDAMWRIGSSSARRMMAAPSFLVAGRACRAASGRPG